MKGQFFIIASVIIVLSLATLIAYVYDFGSIELTEVGENGPLEQLGYIKTSLNSTVYSSFSSRDCNKLRTDVNSTIKYLKNELSKNGITLTVDYFLELPCPPVDIDFNYSLKTHELFTITEFSVFIA